MSSVARRIARSLPFELPPPPPRPVKGDVAPEKRISYAKLARRSWRNARRAAVRAFNAPLVGLDTDDARRVKNGLKTLRRAWRAA